MSEYVKYYKDPDSVLPYSIDWSDFLGVDTIVASDWEVPASLVEDSSSFVDDSTTIWLSGGDLGSVHRVTNRITTAAGIIDDRSFHVQIEEQ